MTVKVGMTQLEIPAPAGLGTEPALEGAMGQPELGGMLWLVTPEG